MIKRYFTTLSSFILVACWCSTPVSRESTLLMSPYLQAVTANSIYVLVESSTTDPVTVEYGPTSSYGGLAQTEYCDTTTNATFIHNIRISGLSSGELYHYRVTSRGMSGADATFRTALPPGKKFRFAWMADCRSGVTVHDTVAKRIREAKPVMSLYGGDLSLNAKYDSFKEQFFRPEELALIASVPFFNAPGNHEKWSPNTIAFTQAPPSPSGTQAYYSFDYGDMHVLVLNNEIPDDESSPQYQFAARDLAATTQVWKVVIAHKPAYCAGGHGEDKDMKRLSENVFVPNHVDVVFGGHTHFFQHNLVDGVHHLVIGSAGAPLYDTGTAPYVLRSAKEYNYGIVDVSPSSFNLVVYNEKGMPLDTLSLRKQ